MVASRLLPVLLRQRQITPASLFRRGEVGAWFDPADLTAIYQDSVGTEALTAIDQPAGLLLDKSSGLLIGSELVTNGGFDSGVSWSGAAWSISGGVAACAGASGLLQNTMAFGADGKTFYKVSLRIVSRTSGTVSFPYQGSGAIYVTVPTTPGTYTAILKPPSQGYIAIYSDAFVGTIDDVSVMPIYGNHLTQASSTSRPTLKEEVTGLYRSLAYLGTDDFSVTANGGGGASGIMLCAAIKVGAVGADQTMFSDAGTNTGYRLRLTSANQIELSIGTGASRTAVTTAGTALALNDIKVVLAWHDGTNSYVQIGNDAPAVAACGAASAGTAAITLGRDNGAATSYWTGRLFPMVYLQGSPGNAAQREAMKRYCAAAAGVSL